MAEPSRQLVRGIESWRKRVLNAQMPIFARTVKEVTTVAGSEGTSAADLSRVIGHDAAMASRLLRVAGSTLFNLQGRRIETISEAIVLIGFDAVRELAVSLALIEHVLQGRRHHRVTKNMARAFHAAAQAKSFANLIGAKAKEEVFVAALLVPIGPMSFWIQSGPEGDAIDRKVAAGMSMSRAEVDVLGFKLKELTLALAEEWHLGDLLKASLHGHDEDDPCVRSISLGHAVAEAVEFHGWGSPETRKVLRQVAKELGIAEADVVPLAEANLEEAAKIAEQYGVPRLDEALPPLPEDEADREKSKLADGMPDPDLQLRILKDLSSGAADGKSLNEMMHLVLRGIHEGVGFDRVYFALLTPDRKQMQARYVLGRNPESFSGATRTLRNHGDLFRVLLERGQALTMSAGDRAAGPDYVGWLAYGECAVMPILVRKKPVGLLYGDRAFSRRPVDDESFASFKLFGEQIVALLSR